ncbi:MAG: alpha-amylase family glycosyl hydrolase [Prevotella sp.]|nr:alpha-amylase family glycosyl hydrolase [Prevotella sp.]
MKKTYRLLLSALLVTSALITNAATFVGNRTDFRDETIYFAMTTRFYDGDPTNNTYCWDGVLNVNDPEWRGDFKGLIDKLDYIKALGFTAVWITPVVENGSGLDYHGYHAMDFSKIDHRYVGKSDTDADADVAFQTLIDEVHKRGMKIILDIVLQHTGNFGEAHLCKMFEKDYSIDLGDISCMKVVPQSEGGKLPENYASMTPTEQYGSRLALMKNTDFQNHDIHNYWHHKAWFDWDDPSRWWGQIAGDCVDLNTEHPAVSSYIVECYSRFIKMGVDGFRIDTAGHIPRLSFNNNFLPQFQEAAESAEAKAKRGDSPFFMFGEVCARSMEVIYRGANYNCSPCYYTWKESKDYPWDYDPASWDNVEAIPTPTEGSQDYETVSGHTNWESALRQGEDDLGHSDDVLRRSDNALLNGNDYHTPDHSDFSGMSVIDFAMHWNFNSAAGAFGVHTQDYLYNDATYNVVYVDSHDYAPDSNYRFSKDQATWAENLSLMFTFRGIPCLFYGSEVEFQKGKDIDKGAVLPLKETGRAYFGGYIEGNVNVTDFAEYSDATGNMASTLTYPLARHIQRLNKIRAAVPALRKGQYSTEGCSGNLSFKRRYTEGNTDSYVLVTISGNSTFTNILNGTYVDAVTGDIKNVTNNTLTAECSGKGNMRVYVLNGPGKIGDDGKYLYDDASVDQPWAEWPDETMPDETWTKKPVTGGSETGGSGTREEPETATAPAMQAGEQAIFLYHESWNNATVWIWDSSKNYTGGTWPGEKLQYLGNNMYKWTYTGTDVIPEGASIIFSNNGNEQSPGNNEGGYKYVNGGVYKIGSARDPYEVISAKGPNVTISPQGGKFVGSQEVTITAANATSAWYKVGSGSEVPFTGTATFTIGADMNVGETVTVSWSATDGTDTTTGSAEFTKAESLTTVWHIFFDNSSANWGKVNCYIYGSNECHEITGGWPGSAMTFNGEYYEYVVETSGALDECNVIFSNGSGEQTGNNVKVRNYGVYNYEGDTGITAGIINIPANDANTTTEYFNLQGIRIMKPAIPGIYITKKGNKVIKAYIHK